MRTVHIINGPNLNMLGAREPEIYGATAFEDYLDRLRELFPSLDIIYFQSNHEGDLIDYLQQDEVRHAYGVVINGGAFSHYSYAIADALRMVEAPLIEVHISNTYAREDFRQRDVLAPACEGVIIGMGLDGYRLALANLSSRRI
ncbi:MAG: type II 3-dehydroquinate dehydratase [Porphyromonas sp.]|uniref:type II 3-dehydroquinate dehydratase n=1 Tax=Porphyromonas sp. TaxID=1924944 RepID=UPI002A91E731|nr:type II 3-dehydroquinate dehydratase [Porphyromonas sp.]MDD7468630.1 3-dehydroquinate dehydratase [Bacteroidales bacterium]MDY6102004.1 type II 3-dehydroquinate dehydratase [Porphyromonas sp.]